MISLFLFALLLDAPFELGRQTRMAPTGLYLRKVVVEPQSSRWLMTVSGRFSGPESGRVYFDLEVKKAAEVLGTHRTYLDLEKNQKFSRSFSIRLSDDPKGARCFFVFEELRPR